MKVAELTQQRGLIASGKIPAVTYNYQLVPGPGERHIEPVRALQKIGRAPVNKSQIHHIRLMPLEPVYSTEVNGQPFVMEVTEAVFLTGEISQNSTQMFFLAPVKSQERNAAEFRACPLLPFAEFFYLGYDKLGFLWIDITSSESSAHMKPLTPVLIPQGRSQLPLCFHIGRIIQGCSLVLSGKCNDPGSARELTHLNPSRL
jgi:hypothetical protein